MTISSDFFKNLKKLAKYTDRVDKRRLVYECIDSKKELLQVHAPAR